MTRLPDSWYLTLAELAHEWGCHQDRVRYFLDSGLLVPSVLIPKWRAAVDLRDVPAPNVCLSLPGFRSMEWVPSGEGLIAKLQGAHMGFFVDGDGFRLVSVNLVEPVGISFNELVVTVEERERLEELAAPRATGRINRAERKTFLWIIRALAMAAYAKDMDQPYRVARFVCADMNLVGGRLSQEVVAQKLKEARALVDS